MRRTEAREWVRRYRDKAREIGARQAHIWWLGVIADIERKRGQEAALDLRVLMNEERKK